MPMTNEPTTGEIVRALRCSADNDSFCKKCQYGYALGSAFLCDRGRMNQNASDRLESQEREIEELKSEAFVAALDNAERIANLTARAEQAERERDAAKADMTLLAGETVSEIKCSMCRYNLDDIGCELDGSQFDDDGECHFEWRGLPQDGEGV